MRKFVAAKVAAAYAAILVKTTGEAAPPDPAKLITPMPQRFMATDKELRETKHALDMAVDRAYRREAFVSDRHRVEYLMALYEKNLSISGHA